MGTWGSHRVKIGCREPCGRGESPPRIAEVARASLIGLPVLAGLQPGSRSGNQREHPTGAAFHEFHQAKL
ncbi:hypothetical protein RR42_s3401 [Cupriavidus basilensis]|uniref:Uncharacterized protein n=1 Tax=Cupriavidus basilensis TaxID=68895 RepID=A0A0C4YGI9_9BURK|nr:hypothetical protein RR42_s3401 [Cupriavidus basilensis]